MKSVYADTNIFLRFLLNDIPKQADIAHDYFKKAQNKKLRIFVCQIVIFEIDFILGKFLKQPKNEVLEKVKTIVNSPYIDVEDKEYFTQAIELNSKNNVDLVDCFIYSKAMGNNAEVLSFDEDFKKLSK